jgi:Mn2+/Fe2+ NRAMP family transporter
LVSGRGLGGVLRQQYPRAVVYPAVLGLVLANTLNAGADIGAIAAAINLLVPIPAVVFVIPVSLGILGLQVFGSYQLIANVFKWLTLALLAYVGAALFARPNVLDVQRGTLIPTFRLDPAYIGILVAFLIQTLRIKLQNDYRHPRFIATIPGQCYRFIPTFTNAGWDIRPEPDNTARLG